MTRRLAMAVLAAAGGVIVLGLTGVLRKVPGVLGVGRMGSATTAEMNTYAAQPLQTYLQPIRLSNDAASTVPRTFIRCTSPRSTMLDHVVERLQGEPGWRYRELASGHGAVTQAPRELTALVLEIVQEDGREAKPGSACGLHRAGLGRIGGCGRAVNRTV